VHQDQVLIDRRRRQAALPDQVAAQGVDALNRDRRQRELAARPQDVVAQGEAVVAKRRSAPAALMLEIAKPLVGGVGKRDRRPRSPGDQAPTARVGQDRVEHLLGAPLGEIALGWTTPADPGLADHALVLTCGVAPLGHPAITRLALLPKDMAADGRLA
jgi:hypothetical protein